MGLLIEGKWHDQWYDTKTTNGEFIRSDAQFRHTITADGTSGFQAEPNRYHLYVSYACPWAHRVLIFRKLKGLEEILGVSVVDHFMGEKGWTYSNKDGAIPDPFYNSQHHFELYTRTNPNYTGRVTVPVLWDTQTETIVNNESSEIIRMLNSEFNEWGNPNIDFYPRELREDINNINEPIYNNINNGVYRCGFATQQDAYERAYNQLFSTLDRLEERLSQQNFLCHNEIVTEADWRLFTTLLRFDIVYFGHFKCNRQRIQDYPNLWDYTRTLYQVDGVAETCNFQHIKAHYYASHETINPTRIVPKGPNINFNSPTQRDVPKLNK